MSDPRPKLNHIGRAALCEKRQSSFRHKLGQHDPRHHCSSRSTANKGKIAPDLDLGAFFDKLNTHTRPTFDSSFRQRVRTALTSISFKLLTSAQLGRGFAPTSPRPPSSIAPPD